VIIVRTKAVLNRSIKGEENKQQDLKRSEDVPAGITMMEIIIKMILQGVQGQM
jgi:hypothetical protein